MAYSNVISTTRISGESDGGYIASLDGFRAFSVFAVFLSHIGFLPSAGGRFGVMTFFFLSGFLITTLLIRKEVRHGAISIRAFYLRRLIRIIPPLLATMVLGVVLVHLGLAAGKLDPGTILSQIFFFYNYQSLGNGDATSVEGFVLLWSLSVEEHFYLIWPLMFLLILKGWVTLSHLSALIFAVLLWRCVRVFVFDASVFTIYISTDTRFDSLLYGCLLALMNQRGISDRIFLGHPGKRVFFLLGACVLIGVSMAVAHPAFRSTLAYSLQGLALIPIFYYAVTAPQSRLFQPLNWGPVRQVGQWSYTLYLVHHMIIEALHLHGITLHTAPILFLSLAAGLSILWAHLVFVCIERPLRAKRAQLAGH